MRLRAGPRHALTGLRRAGGVIAVAAMAVGLVACSSSSSSESASEPPASRADAVLAGRPYEVTTSQLTLVDPSRPTPPGNGGPAEASRTIGVWLTLPVTDAPAPLIVFSHGMAGHPRHFEALTRAWAKAGYAVAALVFPRTNQDVPSALTNNYDIANQPGDVRFVLDQLLARSAGKGDELTGRLDADHIGVAGLSAGGFTSLRVALDPKARDPRVDAVIGMSAPGATPQPTDPQTGAVPVFLMHGDRDPLVSPASVRAGFAQLEPPRYLLTILGGGHAGPFQDAEDATFEAHSDAQAAIIDSTSVAFWDRYLLGDRAAEGRLVRAGTSAPTVATFRYDVG